MNPKNAVDNAKKAMDAAEKWMDVPQVGRAVYRYKHGYSY